MADSNAFKLPEHLASLLDPTPSGVAKLIAAWDGLSTESQILLLAELEKGGAPAYLHDKVRIKALDSANPYVRYLVARKFYFSDDDSVEKRALKRRIEEDPHPLVKYCLMETEWGIGESKLKSPSEFYSLPHEARLALVRRLDGQGEEIAKLIEHALNHQLRDGSISEIELFEILSDYVNKPEFKARYDRETLTYDGFGEYEKGKDIEALWQLVLKLPEWVSHILIQNLPPGAGLSANIPNDVLNGMNDRQLATLFDRRDIDYRDLRKKVFFEAGEDRDRVRGAATCHHFDLTYSEFADILAKPEEEKISILTDLAMLTNDLSLCLYDAIHDILFNTDVGLSTGENSELAHDALERKLKWHTGWQREKQILELRLYRLAKLAVPRGKTEEGYPPSDELSFLANAVVRGDTWKTFMAFSEIWKRERRRTENLEGYLPDLDEFELDDQRRGIEHRKGEERMP